MLLALLCAVSAAVVSFTHPTCTALIASTETQVRVANRCAGYAGVKLDFAPTLDSACSFNTCTPSESAHWTILPDGSVKVQYNALLAQCPGLENTHLYSLPIDCETGNPIANAEELNIHSDFTHGYSIEFRRNWWTNNEQVMLEFVTQTVNSGKIIAIDSDDESLIKPMRNSGCSDKETCEQTWHFLLMDFHQESFTMHVRLQHGTRILREKVTFNIVIVPGQVSEWQRAQVVDALLFDSGLMETPLYPNDRLTEGDQVCAYAVAPGAESLAVNSAQTCNDNECFSVSNAQPAGTDTSFFCFTVQKRAEHAQSLEIAYQALIPEETEPSEGLQKRSWTWTTTSTGGTVFVHMWKFVVLCPDTFFWDGHNCAIELTAVDDWFWWGAAIFTVLFVLICICALYAFVFAPQYEDKPTLRRRNE